MKKAKKDWRGVWAVIMVVCGVVLAGANATYAWDEQPRILPMQEKHHGHTYGEWAAKWWQWAIGTPAATNPIIDTTGEFCASDQKGPVWFLATTLGWSPGVVRECDVPLGKSLFFPVINSSYFAFPNDPPMTEAELRAVADCRIPTELSVEIDGVPVKNLYQYFEHSPVFEVSMPAGDIFGLGPMLFSPSVDQGYYLLIEPLDRGAHSIHWKASWLCPFQADPFTEEVTYNLSVGYEKGAGKKAPQGKVGNIRRHLR